MHAQLYSGTRHLDFKLTLICNKAQNPLQKSR